MNGEISTVDLSFVIWKKQILHELITKVRPTECKNELLIKITHYYMPHPAPLVGYELGI